MVRAGAAAVGLEQAATAVAAVVAATAVMQLEVMAWLGVPWQAAH